MKLLASPHVYVTQPLYGYLRRMFMHVQLAFLIVRAANSLDVALALRMP